MSNTPLKDFYTGEVREKLTKTFNIKNPMQVPKLAKIVISMGVANALKDKQHLEAVYQELTLISGQKPLRCKAKKSIANYKSREGMIIGFKVTLRNRRMYDFMYKFIHIAVPRISDFRGFKDKCDGRGNYSLGIDNQNIMPEVNLNEIKITQGMNITFVTTAKSSDECREFLKLMGIPFKKK